MRKIVLFGDSITAGYLDEAVSPVLVDLVKRDIAAMGLEEVAVINAGMPGDTTEDGLKRLNKEVLIEKPDEVVIFFGANDASLDRNITVATFRENLETMIHEIGSEKVILITPPYADSGRRPERPQTRIKELVKVAQEVGAAHNLPVIDLYKAMTVYPGTDEFLQADGLHFSQVGYELLGSLIVREIKGRLKPKQA